MRQVAQYQDGRLELQEVPVPAAAPGGVLVRVTHSVISVGTERMKVEQAKMNLLQKARARPDQVRKVLDTAKTLGWTAAIDKVRNRLETPSPLGYSACGVVEAVDPANTRFCIGDRVAVGGAECAFHADYVSVPDLLAAKVPAKVESWQAAYTTVTSIALQGVRQLAPSLGDRVLVIGQGLVGLLVTALLRISGVRVMAVDLVAGREALALEMGAERVVILGRDRLSEQVPIWTDNYGVDAVMLCTASQSNEPVLESARALRDRGRIVIVGNTRAELPWKTFYEKELEVRYSRSYGPGRYDPSYEQRGTDYPIGYVRWTEQRNFEACLQLMRTGALDVTPLTTRRVPFSQAVEAYQTLLAGATSDVGIVFEYGGPEAASSSADAHSDFPAAPQRRPHARPSWPVTGLDVIGAGNFARTMLLPHLKGRLRFGTVVNNTALSARHVKAKFGFEHASTDAMMLLQAGESQNDGDLRTSSGSAVLIATRHHLHARLVSAALAGNRHVFVEKPLCLNRAELAEIDVAMASSAGSVHVGFNRRFAGASADLKRLLSQVPGPKTASIRVVPGKLDPSHWYADYAESGGRILGETCHFLDYFCFLFESSPTRVTARTAGPAAGRLPFPDSITAQVEFADGSCGQLIYNAEADPSWPKEQCTVYGTSFVAEVVNFQQLVIHHRRKKTKRHYRGKGHAEQMAAWLAFLRGEAAHPFPYELSRRSMLLTFAVLESIRSGRAVEVVHA
jgi:predicted dehydrogenase/threonine dehydrogenase-like Zn-dependent dehydrogenase